jgi:hypothetical protein
MGVECNVHGDDHKYIHDFRGGRLRENRTWESLS